MWSRLRSWLRRLLRPVIRTVVRLEASGLERIPRAGPLIVINNHVNWLDAVLTILFAPRHIVGFSKAENFRNPLMAPLVRLSGAIPVRRGTPDMAAIRGALDALAAGKALLIDPEGTRSHHGRLQPAHSGVVFIALRSGAPILPVAIWGQEQFWHNLFRLRRTHVHLRVGFPFYLRAGEKRVRREERERILREVMYQLAALLPPAYRGVYADLENATEEHLVFPPGAQSNLLAAEGRETG